MVGLSNYTVLRNLDDRYFAVNLLYGTIDELDEDLFKRLTASELDSISEKTVEALNARHHIQSESNQQLHMLASLPHDSPRVQFFIPLTNSCNLACPYCFQGAHDTATQNISSDSIELVFSAIADIANLRQIDLSNCEVVLYGGEPLLPNNACKVEAILQAAERKAIPISIITNGTTIGQYLETLTNYSSSISNITITLDGDQNTHDRRRAFCDGRPTYELIYKGIEALRQNNLPCTIRINLDSDLINQLRHGEILLPEGKKEIHRVTGVHDEMSVSLKSLMSLCLSGICSINDMGENQVIALYSLLNPNVEFSPLLNNCPENSIYYFSLNKNTICSCNESDGDTLVVGNYRPHLILHTQADQPSVICRLCPVYPVCGGGCRKLSATLSNWKQCRLFNEIIDMLDYCLEYMTGKHYEQH